VWMPRTLRVEYPSWQVVADGQPRASGVAIAAMRREPALGPR
jgi:hypothetical protein